MFRQGLNVAIPFFWAGLLVAISFLEAPLKFQAPGITLTLGLGIGQLVFTTLNRIEWVLAGLLVLSLWPSRLSLTKGQLLLVLLLLTMLFIQTVGLLPVLNQRVLLYQHNPPLLHRLSTSII